MSTRKTNKNIILLILLLVIVGMAVGYAALSQALVINGTANITTEWKILFTNIEAGTLTGAENKTSPSFTATTATFDVNLLYPGATAEYIVTVANQGNINAVLTSVDGISEANAAAPTEITYTIDAQANDALVAGEEKTYKVTVSWDASSETIPETKSKTATITLNYEQAE